MATWWTSDTHFSHVNIIRYCDRPFATVDEMNAEMIARWNDTVAPADDVWHLGDLALGQDIRLAPAPARRARRAGLSFPLRRRLARP
jgi:calcineurin-like phosphoesterase family protein